MGERYSLCDVEDQTSLELSLMAHQGKMPLRCSSEALQPVKLTHCSCLRRMIPHHRVMESVEQTYK